MSINTWTEVDRFLESLYSPDEVLTVVRERNSQSELPNIAVSDQHGRFLAFLARATNARTVLEIGTLGGFSAICLARALPKDGVVVTLEVDSGHAEAARQNIAIARATDRIEVVVGPALKTLPTVRTKHPDGFDFIFIDADKEGYPEYWRWALRLAHPGTVIVADNVVRDGGVADPSNHDVQVEGVREYLKLAAAEPTVLTSTLQTVGIKGYDGFSFAVVLST